MAIVRLRLGENGSGAPLPSPATTDRIADSERYFSDFQSYLVGLYGFAQAAEAANSGHALPYPPEDTVLVDCKQSGERWVWRPEPTISVLMKNISPTAIALEKVGTPQPPPSAEMNLGALDGLLHNFGQALATNYFERQRPQIEARYGKTLSGWPPVWNFARVVRNAMSHGGQINFTSTSAAPVAWKQLTYTPASNGRSILHSDLWPGDLFNLIIEMDASL